MKTQVRTTQLLSGSTRLGPVSVAMSVLCDVNTGVFDLTECAPTWEKNFFKYLPKLYVPLNQLGEFSTLSIKVTLLLAA